MVCHPKKRNINYSTNFLNKCTVAKDVGGFIVPEMEKKVIKANFVSIFHNN